MNRILLIAADDAASAPLVALLAAEGYEVRQAVEFSMMDSAPDLILCANVSAARAIELCATIRVASCFAPVLVLLETAGGCVEVLQHGADSCLSPPVDAPELLAFVHSLLRRASCSEWAPWTRLHVGSAVVNLVNGMVVRAGDVHQLSPPQLAILRALAASRERPLSSVQLMRSLGPASTRTLAQHLKALRACLEPDPAQPRYLLTFRGRGYQLVGGALRLKG